MVAPAYTEDLSDITVAENTTNWVALGGGASGLGAGPDFAMEGTNCVDKQITAAEKGQVYDFGTTITPGANTHFFIWAFLATPGVSASLANRGLTMVLGTLATAYNKFHVEGNDTYGAAGRVGKCYPIRYVTTSSGSAPYRTLVGSPGANPQFFGAMANITGSVKSANLGVDAMRYGTGIYITAGDSGTPATFTGAATANDAITARWGVLSWIAGSNYELQGRFVVGQNNAYSATLAYFEDSNKNILLVDTPHSLTDFTQIIVDHASTVFNMTNITIEAAGTNNPGRLVFNNASTTSALTGCNFVKFGITTLRAGATATNCVWRQADQITLNGATLTGCTISNNISTSAVVAATPAGAQLITNSNFTSDGTGYGLEITGTAADTTLTNCTWSGYAATDGTSGNEAIFVNIATGAMTLTITGGSIPTIRTAGCVVTKSTGARTVTVKSQTALGAAIGTAMVNLETASGGGGGSLPYNVTVTIVNSGTLATVTHATHLLVTGDKVVIRGASHNANNGVFAITKIDAGSYSYTMLSTPGSSPTGTIKSTYVLLYGTTDAGTGEISVVREFLVAQPVTGWARKMSASPFYKEGPINTTVSSTANTYISATLVNDE